jgi:hypothetical protein
MVITIQLNSNIFKVLYNIKNMKFTHTAITSIMVEKVENIYTNFTRAGNGDDMHRRQR